MANKNKTRSSNDDDMDSNESSDEDGRCLPTTARPISTSLLLSNQQKIAEEKQSKNAEQSYINQQIHGYTRTHHDVLYRQNHHGVQLDHCVPSSNFASSQHYLPAEHFDCPRDERVRWMDDYKFSSTIDEYFIHFRESECIEDTQAHHMPPTIVLNTFSPNQITNGENNRINMDVITQNNPSQIVATLRLIHIPAEATVTGNAITKVPEEIPQQSLIPDSFIYIEENDAFIHGNNQIVEALSNNAAIADVVLTSTSSNQMNNVDEQSARTELTNDTLSPETLEITRDVATNEVTPQAVLYVTDEPVTTVPKLPTALEQSDDSNKGIRQTTTASNYYCNENNQDDQFTLSASLHAAWQSTLNCSLQQCNTSFNDNNNCRLPSTLCFNYRSLNNTGYCASGILCSILEPCDNVPIIVQQILPYA
ncbi:unnamed protein product [Rotaria sp. Silwood1]|nr:unnamed protein product [Rotaria sp. Silwood1]CAF4907016.1 unnamed protein product [Rotaria sp. Silwood1]